AVTVVIGLYLTILFANMGGYVDEIRRGDIRETVTTSTLNDPNLKTMTAEQRTKILEERIANEEKRLGLDRPFLIRSMAFLKDAFTLNWGLAKYFNADNGSGWVKLIVLELLPATLLLFGTTNIFLFFFTLFAALSLSRQYGSWLDKLIVGLSPMSAAP